MNFLSRPAVRRPLFAGACAAAVLTAASMAPAQSPAPFAQIPGDAELLMRIDLQAFESAPVFADIVETLRASSPNYGTGFLTALGKGDPGMARLGNSFPGSISAYEFGADLDGMDMTTAEAPFYALAHGQFDKAAIGEALMAGTWSNLAAVGDAPVYGNGAGNAFVAVPSDSTMAMASSAELLGSLATTSTGAAPSVAQGPLAGLIGGHGQAPFMMAFQLTPPLREQLAALAAAPPQESYMIAGLPEAIKEATNLTSGALSLGGSDSASVSISLGFADDAAAGRALQALNKAIPAMAALGKMQAGEDPQAMQMIQQYEQLRFDGSGSLINLSVPIPAEAMAAVAPALAQQLEQSTALFGDPSGSMSIDGGTMDLGEEPAPTSSSLMDGGDSNSSASDADLQHARIREMGAQYAGGLIPVEKREAFPIAMVLDIDGNGWHLSDHSGKVLVVDCWTSTVADCTMTAPYMSALARKFKPNGLEMVGFSFDTSTNAARKFAAATAMNWPIVCDEMGMGSSLVESLGIQKVPTAFIVDRQGRVAAAGLQGMQVEAAALAALAEEE